MRVNSRFGQHAPTRQSKCVVGRCWLVIAALGITSVAMASVGCGPSASSVESKSDAAGSSSTDADGSAASTVEHKSAVKGKKNGTRSKGPHIGEIPKDAWPEVFFDNPLEIAADKTIIDGELPPAKSSAEPAVATDVATKPPPVADNPTSTATAASDEWASVLPEEVLTDEVKTIKSSLNAKLQSVGIYSGKYKELRVDAATLVALAGLIGEHPANPSWKPNAKYIRDVAAEIVKSATANGPKFYKPSKNAYDKLESLLSGSKPPGIEESADKLPYTEVSSREQLMYRIERAFKFLKSDVNTAETMKKEAAKVAHEASVLASLAKVLASPGNSDADDSEYHRYAIELEQSGLAIAGASRDTDYESYTKSLDRASKACTNCHLYIK
ncbi:MAG: hypothetical protein EXS05_06290 [Planctomycetaceae bacterium]|nr:hypothetical protein [Planctomycetaceae bacterium]